MAYSEALAERVRDELGSVAKVEEKAMFGGIAFMVAGHMACGVNGDDVIVRLDPTLYHDALTRPNAREMDFTGRPMKGFVAVGPGNLINDDELELWVRLGVTWAKSLPPKAKAKAKAQAQVKKAAKKRAAPAKRKAATARRKAAPAKRKAAPAKAKAAPAKAMARKKAVKKAVKAVKKTRKR